MRSTSVLCMVAALAACGDGGPTFTDAPVGGDDAAIGGDAAPDVDAASDVDAAPEVDAAPSIDADTGEDAGMDAGDAGMDAGDARMDAGDAGMDAGDAGMDAGDAGMDAGDAGMDAGDAGMDAGDAGMDAGGTPDAVMQQQFYWADWTSATAGTPGSASGTFAAPSGTVTITYSGELRSAQTSGGTNYWLPDAPYINAVTANGPSPNTDIIRISGSALTNTVTFDPPVTGLVMGILSLGQGGANVKYVFDTNITLLSYGQGYYGNGVIAVEGTSTISGNEGHGAIQFAGTVSSISWTTVNAENWHGFTFGIPNQ